LTDLRAQLQATLGGAYTLERELGGGGMSRVFVATETALGREVVLKVLPPDLAAGVSVERFRREILLAAKLQHAHIVPLLSAGDVNGLPYFTMPFIEGESLRERLVRRGELSITEAVRLLREVASALAYAHSKGIVHRDIKPDNVMVSHGDAMVTDFGVAKALAASATSGDHGGAGLTSLGVALGTPAYMAPEQAAADPSSDSRVDIYAFGAMAYELLSGVPPFSGRPASAILAAQIAEAPEPISKRRPNVTPALSALVMRCLEKRPADRPQGADEIVNLLEAIATPSGGTPSSQSLAAATMRPATATPPASGAASPATPAATPAPSSATPGPLGASARNRNLWVAAAAVVVLAALGFAFKGRFKSTGAAPGGPVRMAVLPFENIGDSADAYFADGVSDAVRGKLTKLPDLAVTARASSVLYRRSSKTPQQIGDELGVQYLLTGTVRWAKGNGKEANRVQVSPELIQVSTANSKWQQSFDASITDVFQVQGQIAEQVANALNVALGSKEQQQLTQRPTANLAAYDAYLKGEAASPGFAAASPADLRRAIGFYQQAIERDSGFALAWAQLSRGLSYLYEQTTPSPALATSARDAAQRAVTLAPNLPEGQLALGDYYGSVLTDFPRAQAAYDAALKLAPPNADALTASALAAQSLGRWDVALDRLQQSQRLDPRSVTTARRLGTTLLRLKRYPEAQAAFDRGFDLAPTNLDMIEGKVMVALAQGDLQAARAALHSTPSEVDSTTLVAYLGNYWDLYWVLDEPQQRVLLRSTPVAFDDSRLTWAVVLMQVYQLRGDAARMRAFVDTTFIETERVMRETPNDPQRWAFRGLAYAYIGRKADAIHDAEHAAELTPVSHDSYTGPYIQHLLARTYVAVHEPEKAIDVLEALVKLPYQVSPAWLRIDPSFAPLKGNPRFDRLVASQ